MKQIAWIALAAAVLAGAQKAGDAAVEKARAEARQVAGELGERLKGMLGKELSSGGFAGAVKVCSETALQATKEFSAQKGRYVRRVSLKNRNPENAPDAYERRKLQQFARLHTQGKLAEEYSEVTRENGKRVLHYLRPIAVQGMCLTCHGPAEKIPQEVRTTLAARYPADRAMGYAAGELRGAFSVKIALPD
jgi:hypothetical protein